MEALPSETSVFSCSDPSISARLPANEESLVQVTKGVVSLIMDAKPDTVLSFMTNTHVPLCLSLQNLPDGQRPRWFLREGNNPIEWINETFSEIRERNLWWKLLVKAYHQADGIIATSMGTAREIATSFDIPSSKISMIYNPIDVPHIVEMSRLRPAVTLPKGQLVVSAGRLTPQKNFDVLIRALACVVEKVDCSLLILGAGEQRQNLEEIVSQLGLEGRVMLPGFTPNPWSYFADADVFVLPSAWEGFGNVVVEAMAVGVPVIVTSCDYGPKEVVTDGENGVIVPVGNSPALAKALERLLMDQEMRFRLARNGLRRAKDFDAPLMIRQYEKLLQNLMSRLSE